MLKASIEEDGCLDPLYCWGDILIDGHNRFEICRELGKPYKVRRLKFESRYQAIEWVIRRQLGRRNATDEQKAYYRGKQQQAQKQAEGRPPIKRAHNEPVFGRTADIVAREHGVSPATVKRDVQFAVAVDMLADASPDAKAAILTGVVKSTRKDIQAVSELPTKERKMAAKAIASGDVATVKEALEAVWPDEEKVEEPPKDETGRKLPTHLVAAFSFAEKFDEARRQFNAAKKIVGELLDSPAGVFLDGNQLRADLANARRGLMQSPYAICPLCKGKGCEPCRQSGWMPKLVYDNVPKDKR